MSDSTALPKTSRALANAIDDENKRLAIDSAKKRAVSQFADYDTFKNMVSVAHLKPINQQNSKQDASLAPAWTFNADGTPVKPTSVVDERLNAAAASGNFPSNPPASAQDFARDWKRWCSDAQSRIRYLQLCGPSRVGSLFKVEITSTLLCEIIESLVQFWDAGHKSPIVTQSKFGSPARVGAETVPAPASPHAYPDSSSGPSGWAQESESERFAMILDVLLSVQAAGRFPLASKLLPPRTKKGMERVLLEGAERIAAEKGRVADVKQAYGML